jgi:hypothetical protein
LEYPVRSVHLIIIAGALFSTVASAADYRDGPYRSRGHRAHHYAHPAYAIRQVPPTYYVNAPPHFVQDLRTGEPGYFAENPRTWLDQIFPNYY